LFAIPAARLLHPYSGDAVSHDDRSHVTWRIRQVTVGTVDLKCLRTWCKHNVLIGIHSTHITLLLNATLPCICINTDVSIKHEAFNWTHEYYPNKTDNEHIKYH
jgi:hypothetical protein